jgi:HK97 family phage portal protein
VVNAHTLAQVDIVYTALRIISNNILMMGNLLPFTWGWSDDNIKYRQYIRDDRPILTNTFGGGALGGQGGAMMQCTGMDRTVWSMGLFGESFWYILRDPELLTPLAVEVLHPAFMEVKRKDGVVTYTYGTGNNKKELPPENVIHIPLKSLPGANRALSPTDYAGVAGALAMAAYEFGSSWFSQGQAPDFILSTDQKLGTEEVERIADKFMIRHAGLQSAHTPVVVDSGLKAEKVMASPDEAQYLNTLEYSRQVIGAWFGLPPSKMPNALQRQPNSPPHARQEEMISFRLDTLSGYVIPIQEVFSGLLASGEFACFDVDALDKPDAQFQALLIQALRQSQVESINEIRVRERGLPPVDGGDEVIAPLASNVAPEQTPSINAGVPSP